MESHLLTISHAIQLAIAPVFVLTAVAHLLSVLSSRLARIVDRNRVVQARAEMREEMESLPSAKPLSRHQIHQKEEDEIEMAALHLRLRLSYLAIFFLVLSALFICMVVVTGFMGALTQADTSLWLAGMFIASMIAMIISLGLLLREVYVAVVAGKMHRRP